MKIIWQNSIGDHVIDLAWSPNGRFLAAAAVSGPVTVWEADSGRPRWLFKGHGLGTMALSWHPGSHILASGGQDGKVRLWDVEAGRETAVLDGGAAWVEQVAWSDLSKQGRPVLASAAGRVLRFWEEDGTLRREFNDVPSTIAAIAWKPGKRVLAAVAYGGARLYHADQDQPGDVLAWQGSSLALAWSPNGQMLATGDQDSTVHFWYVRQKRDLQMWGYPTKVRELAWDRTSRYLATGGSPDVTIWDCRGRKGPEGSKPQQLRLHEGLLTTLAYQKRGKRLLAGSEDGLLSLWEPAKHSQPVGVSPLPAGVSMACWSPDDNQIAVGLENGGVYLVAE